MSNKVSVTLTALEWELVFCVFGMARAVARMLDKDNGAKVADEMTVLENKIRKELNRPDE